jgi:hypothetical protein
MRLEWRVIEDTWRHHIAPIFPLKTDNIEYDSNPCAILR